jgi:hypothetical protein
LSTHLHLGLHSGLFPSGFPTHILYAFLFSPLFLPNILWHTCSKQELWSHRNSRCYAMTARAADIPDPFRGNGPVNTFPRKRTMQDLGCNNENGVFLRWSVPRQYKRDEVQSLARVVLPCGCGVEYFHRSHASRRRRRKGKPRIWDSKIWSRIPRDSEPKITALARTSSNCKR